MKKLFSGFTILLASLPAFSATPIDLSQYPVSFLAKQALAYSDMAMKEISRSTDFNQTEHIRMQETFRGYPVIGGDAIIHVTAAGNAHASLTSAAKSDSSMNGIVYQGIAQDIASTPSTVFTDKNKEKIMADVIATYQSKMNKQSEVTDKQSQLVIFIDDNNKAHWAYHVQFHLTTDVQDLPRKPNVIVDAMKGNVYDEWDNIKTLDKVEAGGLGGNHKTGQKIFDGLDGHQAKLDVQRDAAKNICIMKNDEVVVKDYRNKYNPVSFDCKATDPEHNNIYWNGNFDAVDTTWSPSNDALYGAKITSGMFKTWYNMPMLVKKGKPMFLPMTVHDPMTNAYWDGSQVVFGNSRGSSKFNPFTQLDTVAHEIAHGFTEHHSNLTYSAQSGGLNEAFSDMAGIAAEYYAFGKTSYLVGVGDVKAEGKALRYMDKPSKDCDGRKPGESCSIDHVDQYYSGLNVHFSSGVFNRVYYNLANTPGWDAKKAFDVMVQANVNYWTPKTTFAAAACGVMKATKDYKYDTQDVANAFAVVGLKTESCK